MITKNSRDPQRIFGTVSLCNSIKKENTTPFVQWSILTKNIYNLLKSILEYCCPYCKRPHCPHISIKTTDLGGLNPEAKGRIQIFSIELDILFFLTGKCKKISLITILGENCIFYLVH